MQRGPNLLKLIRYLKPGPPFPQKQLAAYKTRISARLYINSAEMNYKISG
jgi:hypothetical protein